MSEETVEFVADYKIISANSVEELVKAVKAQLYKKDNEWEPNGAPFVFKDQIHQPMIQVDEDIEE